jgi:hypothetical protein
MSTPEQSIRNVLDDLRRQTDQLDGSDDSIWFVFGILSDRNAKGQTDFTADLAALALHIADTLAATCRDVQVDVVASNGGLQDINAVQRGGAVELVLNWVWQCLHDPDADNIVFKYAGALRDFGEDARAERLYGELEAYRSHVEAERSS